MGRVVPKDSIIVRGHVSTEGCLTLKESSEQNNGGGPRQLDRRETAVAGNYERGIDNRAASVQVSLAKQGTEAVAGVQDEGVEEERAEVVARSNGTATEQGTRAMENREKDTRGTDARTRGAGETPSRIR